MAELPEELIVEVLLWLPVKSLFRFRCLSKSLCAVIDDTPYFIKQHVINTSSRNSSVRKLIFLDQFKINVYDVNFDSQEEILRLEEQRLKSFTGCKRVGGYCNGLFLLFGGHPFGFTIWNPTTNQFRDLPDCPFKAPADVEFNRIVWSGLGYDDSIDEYKAIRVIHVEREVLEAKVEIQVWIYGLKSNIWRRSQNFPYLDYKIDEYKGYPEISYFADGSLHWLCTFNDLKREVVAFDLRKETFSLMDRPICSNYGKLHVLDGCLCVSSYVDLNNVLYMRKKDGVDQFTWTQLYSVRPRRHCVGVLGYLKRENKILLHLIGSSSRKDGVQDVHDHVGSYDLKMKSSAKVAIDKNDLELFGKYASFFCVESLVSV